MKLAQLLSLEFLTALWQLLASKNSSTVAVVSLFSFPAFSLSCCLRLVRSVCHTVSVHCQVSYLFKEVVLFS